MRLKTLGKQAAKRILIGSGGLRVAARLVAPGAVVLMYHSIVEEPRLTENSIGISQSQACFEAHVRAIAQRFKPVSIEEIAEFARKNRRLPANSVAVTFDDGFADNYEVALPILNRYGVPATFYIMVNAVETGNLPWYCRLRFAIRTTRKAEWRDPELPRSFKTNVGHDREAALNNAIEIGARKTGRDQEEFVQRVEKALDVESPGPPQGLMMTWDQVRTLRKSGHTIGAHTLSHPNLAHINREEARAEILGCKKRIEEVLGEPVDHFSYPHPALNPQWSPETFTITRDAGFKSAVLTTCGPVRQGDEPLALKRIYAASDLDQWIWNLHCTYLDRSI